MRSIHGLLALLLISILLSCTGRSAPEVLAKPPLTFDTQREIAKLARTPGVQPDTLWRIEAEYLDSKAKRSARIASMLY